MRGAPRAACAVIDQHHTTEDTGIALGQAVAKALGDKRGIARYADIHLPMDETLSRIAIDRASPMTLPVGAGGLAAPPARGGDARLARRRRHRALRTGPGGRGDAAAEAEGCDEPNEEG